MRSGGSREGTAHAQNAQQATRRRVSLDGRRITVIDVHAHVFVPEVWDLVKDTPLASAARNSLTGAIALGPGLDTRLAYMDREGIDYQAINVNAWGYTAERSLARDLVQVQNEQIAKTCAAHPDRFIGMAALALQHPDLAADQLDTAVRKLGMKGAAIGGSVEGIELSDRRFDPFWAKAEELGVMIFMHPQTAPGTTQNSRLQGKGALGNTIGNPLETTVFLSHLIFEGVLDRFPGLKICGAHAGGYLPSYSGRSDALCGRGGAPGSRLHQPEAEAQRVFQGPALHRHDGLSRRGASAPGGGSRRRSHLLRHRLPVRLARRDRPGSQRVVSEQRTEGGHPRRQPAQAAAHPLIPDP